MNSAAELTTQIITSYVGNNQEEAAALPDLIASVYTRLHSLELAPLTELAPPPVLKPAVPLAKSITADFIICLEDGKKFKSLKRHLRTAYNMTPEEYRAKWGLPDHYPMVAPNYSAKRSQLAKDNGLGLKPMQKAA